MRVLFWGMGGTFSRIVLTCLLKAKVQICGVVVSTNNKKAPPIAVLKPATIVSELPLVTPYLHHHIVPIAWEHHIPVFEVAHLDQAETRHQLAATKPDVACVACFPKRIPTSLLTVPPYGFLNVHPSLLPAYRGPVPLFWMLRQGETQTGVTVCFMDEGLDTGDIVGQTAVSLADGLSGIAIDSLLAQHGAMLLSQLLQQLPTGTLKRQPQGAGGHYNPLPQWNDFHLTTDWSAQRAFNFMRGTAEWGQSYIIDEQIVARTAVTYQAEGIVTGRIQQNNHHIWLQFTPGILQVQV